MFSSVWIPLKFFILLISVPSIATTHIADITSKLNAADPFYVFLI